MNIYVYIIIFIYGVANLHLPKNTKVQVNNLHPLNYLHSFL